jgi:acetyl esterase/lipase
MMAGLVARLLPSPAPRLSIGTPRENAVRTYCLAVLAAVAAALLAADAVAQETPYTQRENVVYGEAHGVGLVMDIFTPSGKANGLGIVDVISGAWHSDRGKIRDHTRAQTFHILCRKGYTVFAVRPGSVTKFSVPEMLAHLNQGIRWVKGHANEYGIDPDRLGLMGASAGGHLACLAAVTAEDGKADAGKTKSAGTRVKAVAVFFPPTDFLNYGGKAIDVRADDRLGQLVRRLAFPQGLDRETAEEVKQKVTHISPARLATSQAPPFLLIHGDADPVVPLQQSEVMLAALKKAGVPAELLVKKGGAHPWPTLHEEVQVIADWFDKQLAAR